MAQEQHQLPSKRYEPASPRAADVSADVLEDSSRRRTEEASAPPIPSVRWCTFQVHACSILSQQSPSCEFGNDRVRAATRLNCSAGGCFAPFNTYSTC